MFRFYGPVNPMGSCRARSVSLTTRLLGRLSTLSGYPVLCIFFRMKLTTALLDPQDVASLDPRDLIGRIYVGDQ